MARQRPRRAARPPLTVRVARIVAPLALAGLGATGVVAFALPWTDEQTAVPAVVSSTPTSSPLSLTSTPRPQPVSRDEPRTEPTPAATSRSKPDKPRAPKVAPKPRRLALVVTGTRYATDDLNIRVRPAQDSKVVTVVAPGTKLKVTSTVRGGFRYVSYDGAGRWVKNAYLSRKPVAKAAGGLSSAPCTSGSSMESGLTRDAVLVHRTLCARFPQVTSFGGSRGGGGFHATGQAVDCMISDTTAGWQLASWVRANARRLGVSEVIYSRRIWTVQRGSEGWRPMSDRGSPSANHDDHVHISVYGNRATG